MTDSITGFIVSTMIPSTLQDRLQASSDIFREYVAERRLLPLTGFRRESLPHLVRYTPVEEGVEGFVTFADLPPGNEIEAVREQVRYFASLREGFEWKVYDLDRPDSLRLLLEHEGFVPGPGEAFMVLPLDHLEPPQTDIIGASVERAGDENSIRHIIAVQESVWGRDFSWLTHTLTERPAELSVYCAYLGGRPVGTGWIDFPAGSRFAELHGGAVVEDTRGLGLCSLLFAVRLREALHRGYRYLAVDATPMSRPVLERRGFVHICDTTPMNKPAP
jgi:hypothetical protein